MKARIVGMLILGFAVGASASSSVAISPHPLAMKVNRPGVAVLRASGSRSAQQVHDVHARKFDATLADLSRHAGGLHGADPLRDMRSLNPAAKFAMPRAGSQPLVLIDAVTRGDPQQLLQALTALGLQRSAVYSNDVSGWLPVANLDAAAARGEVHAMRASLSKARAANTGVPSQGDFVQHSRALRAANALDGTGVTVGVMSDSFDCYQQYKTASDPNYNYNGFSATAADDVASGDLPPLNKIVVRKEATCTYDPNTELPQGDEGRATIQILHDVAPGASFIFNTADNGEAEFAADIGALADAHANIIIDDIGYFDEPFFQDGIVAQAIDAVKARGVAYFSAAGNNGSLAYDNIAPVFVARSNEPNPVGETLLNFDTSNNSTATALPVSIPALSPGEFIVLALQWDQPYFTGAPSSGGATSQVDMCVSGVAGGDVSTLDDDNLTPASCTGTNALGADPNQVMIIGNPVNATGDSAAVTINVYVGLSGGTPPPHRFKLAVEGNGATGLTINQFSNQGATVQGHPNALGAAAVGAVHYYDTPDCGAPSYTLAYYSSTGGTPTLFSAAGAPITPLTRQKPDFVGPDGINNTFLGHFLRDDNVTINPAAVAACQTDQTLPNFFGTSAATPHVAGIAALMLQAEPNLTPDDLYQAMRVSAAPFPGNTPSFTFSTGHGFVLADTLYAQLAPTLPVPPAPTLSLSAATIRLGQSAILTWSSSDNTGCTASNGWTGAQASAGTQTFTPIAMGAVTYSLLCTNATGMSALTSVTLTVTAANVPPAPTVTVAPTAITLGQSATITWFSTAADSCTASGGWSGSQPTGGTATVTPTAVGIQTYSLICTNTAGSSTAGAATLTVSAAATTPGAPSTPTVTVAPTTVMAGTPVTLTWGASTSATQCMATGNWTGSKSVTGGTASITPTDIGTETFTLNCSNAAGSALPGSATLTVTVAPGAPPPPTLTVGPSTISLGQPAALSWSSTNAQSCTASGDWNGDKANSGSQQITPTAMGTSTFTLVCSNANGPSAAATATLTVTAVASRSGGGALSESALAALAALALLSAQRRRSAGTTRRS
jgi:Subtilase family